MSSCVVSNGKRFVCNNKVWYIIKSVSNISFVKKRNHGDDYYGYDFYKNKSQFAL